MPKNKCCQRIGSEQVVPIKSPTSSIEVKSSKVLSAINKISATVKTGIDNRSKKTVTNIDQANRGILISVTPGALILSMVVKKLIAVSVEEAPNII